MLRLLLSLGLLAAAPGSAAADPAHDPANHPATEPAPAGAFSPETEARLDAVVRNWHAAVLFDGAVLVSRDGAVWTGAAGPANRETGTPNTADTRYPIASVTKQFTAVLTLRAVERDRIDLDVAVTDYLPDYRPDLAAGITVRDLLSHTSGLPDMPAELAFEEGAAAGGIGALLARHAGEPLFAPGTDFAYTNTDYHILGAILEKVHGRSFAEILRDEVFEPLGMEHSGIADRRIADPRRARDYTLGEDGGWIDVPPYRWENWHAAGAIASTVGDHHLWNQALTGGKLLEEETYRLMLTPRTDVGTTGNYVALGTWVYPRALPGGDVQPVIAERRGAIGGYAALNVFSVEGDFWICILANHYNEQIHQLPWGSSMPLDLLLVIHGLDPEGAAEGASG